MTPEMQKLVAEEVQHESLQTLLNHCKQLMHTSRSFMGKFYCRWDERLRVYKSERCEDKRDRTKRDHGEPTKMVVPLSAAQVNTFVAFLMALYDQRSRFYEIQEIGVEDQKVREANELILERDLKHNKFDLVLYQFLLDIGRFGFGVLKHSYVEEKRWVKQITPVFDEFGTQTGSETTSVQVTSYEGNKLTSVSPYKFFPDTRLPLTRFEEGEFCACEEEHSRIALEGMEAQGLVAGIEHVTEFIDADLASRRNSKGRFSYIDINSKDSSRNMLVLTEMQVRIVPNKFEIDSDGTKLGPEPYPVLYLVWYANDQRIVRLEPMESAHDNFNFECHQFTPDVEEQINESLVGNIEKLQEVIDWLINSRVTSTSRTMDHQLIVDPTYVDMETLKARSRIIQIKKNAGRSGIDRFIQPLPVQDVTRTHLVDAAEMTRLMEKVTGVNENATGQYHTGRRSATEAKSVAQGAASRLVLVAQLIWTGALGPLGKKLLDNHRAFLSEQTFSRIVGPGRLEATPDLYQSFHLPLTELVGSTDYFLFDGTTSGEKGYLAQSYQELLGILMSNPNAALQLGLDVNKLLQEIYVLRGAPNLKSFALDPQQMQQMMLAQQQLAQANVSQPNPGSPAA